MIGNRIKETTSANFGTGDVTSLSVATNYQTFNTVFSTDRLFTYTIIDSTNSLWETGYGHLSGTTTLVRDQILDNSSGGSSAINFANTDEKVVICGANAHTTFGSMPGVVALSTTGVGSLHISAQSTTTSTAGTNKLILIPHWSPVSMLATGIRFRHAATNDANTYRVGLYSVSETGVTDKLIAESADIDLSASAGTNVTGTFSASVKIYAGTWYYIGFASDAGVDINAYTGGQFTITPVGIAEVSTNFRFYGFVQHNLTGGWSALPATPSFDTYVQMNTNMAAFHILGTLV